MVTFILSSTLSFFYNFFSFHFLHLFLLLLSVFLFFICFCFFPICIFMPFINSLFSVFPVRP